MSGYGRRKVLSRQYAGDPGLFSFLGKAAGALVSNLVPGGSAIVSGVNAAAGLLSKPKTSVFGATSAMSPSPFANPQGPIFSPVQQLPPPPPIQGNQYGLVNIVRPGAGPMLAPPGNNTQSGPGSQWTPRETSACQAGYHKNKNGYYSKRYGFVPAGSVCVKNRRRNPLNPRAASRAMSRLKSAQKAVRFLNKFAFGGHRKAAAAPAAAKGCGCKGRR